MACVRSRWRGAVVLLLVACSDAAPTDPAEPVMPPSEPLEGAPAQVRDYSDEGAVCLSPPGEVGGTRVQVVLDSCASSCAGVEATCSADVAASAIELTATGRAVVERPGLNCSAACLPVVAQCRLPALPDGAYVLRYGTRSTMVTLPIEDSRTQVLAGSSSFACRVVPPLP